MNFFDRKFFVGLVLGMTLIVVGLIVAVEKHNNLVSTSQSSADEEGELSCLQGGDCELADPEGAFDPYQDPNKVPWWKKVANKAAGLLNPFGRLPESTPTSTPDPNPYLSCVNRCFSDYNQCTTTLGKNCESKELACFQSCEAL